MKVGEQALYLAQLKGMSRHDALKSLKYWFEKFEIQAWWNKKVEELSKGMQQKVQFITTVIHRPKLLIFDEPFSGFDPINTNLLKAEILRLKENGATIIFSTHNMGSVEEICDHIALINKARKILDGNIYEIKEQYKTGIFEIETPVGTDVESIFESDSFNLLEQETRGRRVRVKFQKTNGQSNNELLSQLTSKLEICAFREVIPSMNEVFIQVVNQANQK
jgi:ABC-2 type transport system ATP-binding protein